MRRRWCRTIPGGLSLRRPRRAAGRAGCGGGGWRARPRAAQRRRGAGRRGNARPGAAGRGHGLVPHGGLVHRRPPGPARPGGPGSGRGPGGQPAAGALVKAVKEQLRAVPGDGLGYGLLRYLNPDTGPALAARPGAQIGFNYLGRFTARPRARPHRPAWRWPGTAAEWVGSPTRCCPRCTRWRRWPWCGTARRPGTDPDPVLARRRAGPRRPRGSWLVSWAAMLAGLAAARPSRERRAHPMPNSRWSRSASRRC